MLKKFLASGIAMTLGLSLILSGCGAPKDVATQTDSATTTTATTSAVSTEKVEVEPVTLKFLGFKSGKELGALPEINKAFQDANPGITIEYDAIPTTTNYEDVLKARLATGDGPDVFMSHIGVSTLADAGYVEDLSNEPWAATVLDTFMKAQKYKEKIYTLPIESAGLGLFVNMTVLEKNGIALPTNWAELQAASEKLKASGLTPFIFGNKTGWSGAILINGGWVTEHKDYEDNITSDLVSGKVKASEAWGSYIKKYETIINKGWSNDAASLGMEFNDAAVAEFAKGNSAFLVGGTWMISQIRDTLKGQKTVFTAVPLQDNGPAIAQLIAGTCLAINPQNPNVDVAKKLVAFWADDNNMKKWVISQSAFTTLKGGTSMSDPEAKPFADTIVVGNATLGPKTDDVWKNVDLWTPMTKEVQLLSIKKSDAKKVGKVFDETVKKTLALQK